MPGGTVELWTFQIQTVCTKKKKGKGYLINKQWKTHFTSPRCLEPLKLPLWAVILRVEFTIRLNPLVYSANSDLSGGKRAFSSWLTDNNVLQHPLLCRLIIALLFLHVGGCQRNCQTRHLMTDIFLEKAPSMKRWQQSNKLDQNRRRKWHFGRSSCAPGTFHSSGMKSQTKKWGGCGVSA